MVDGMIFGALVYILLTLNQCVPLLKRIASDMQTVADAQRADNLRKRVG